MDAAELIFSGRCTARCLLAMETPPGWVGCTCACDGRFHAALIGVEVFELMAIRDADGEVLGRRPPDDRMPSRCLGALDPRLYRGV